jgi:hypothetical protein
MKWKLALAQHPMYLLIREDTQCAERTPPWGAPDIESYIDRVRQNLGALRRYSRLKLGYEWSGVELELLMQDAPDVLSQMRVYAQENRVQFYNGSYAQPHLQILSSEANLRQFKYGKDTYRKLGLGEVKAYVHQEASVHDQVPQLLRAFGIEFAAVPGFLSTLVWLDEGELVLHGVRGPRFVQGNEFAGWQGLDGTQIPLYLHQPIPREMSLNETLAREAVLGRLRVPPILIDMPDMIDIDPDWMAEREAVDFVLLNEALEERFQCTLPHPRARLYTHWSYLQGIRAEELARTNFEAELSTLRAEAIQTLAFVLLGRRPTSTMPIWRTILTCQHHDVYCFSAPELRDKAIGWLWESNGKANRMVEEATGFIATSIDTSKFGEENVVVFNTLPHSVSTIAELDVPGKLTAATDQRGNPIPMEAISSEGGRTHLRFPVQFPGLGYVVCALKDDDEPAVWTESKGDFEFENHFLRASVSSEGIFQSLQVMPDEFELLDISRGGGNQLTATDSEAISLKQEVTAERLKRLTGEVPVRGPDIHWEATSPLAVLRSPLGAGLRVSGRLGNKINAELLVRFYHNLPRADITWTFNFRQASVGTFFDDDTKLNVHWPFAFSFRIYNDIPFGIVETRRDRPFFPTSWVDICDGRRGLAFFHRGTQKHWVRDDTLVRLIAWGEDTDAIHNGLGRDRWLKSFDQRLNGSHRIESAIYVHTGDWRVGNVAQAALAYTHPPVATLTGSHAGALPTESNIMRLAESDLIATAVFTRNEQVVCRVFSTGEQITEVHTYLDGLREEAFHSIRGEAISNLAPFQIGELVFETESQ